MEVSLKWTNVVFLPPNVTSIVQPMDQGIIKTLKTLYRSKLLRKKLQLYEANDEKRVVTIRDAITMIKEAWDDVKPPTIINCFVKAGFDVARIRCEQMDAEEAEAAREAEAEAARLEVQATRLLDVQVIRYNDLITTDTTIQMLAQDFISLPMEDAIHEDIEAPADEEGPSTAADVG